MAFQVDNACYATEIEAGQVIGSKATGMLVGQGNAQHTVSVASVDATSITYVLTPVGGGTAITHVAAFTPQPCNLMQLEDGLVMGWLVFGAWIAAYAVLFVKHALMGETQAEPS